MLSLHQHPERLRHADNLFPTRAGGMATRPGAVQLIAGVIDQAKPWGARIIAEKAGRLIVWDGQETDLCGAGLVLQATTLQTLTANAEREDRLYIADGLNSLWFVARRNGAYVRESVTNTVLDGAGAPYPIPIPHAIATWRNRLWITFGTNRVQHCQNDAPAQWDPLWTVECQSSEPDRVRAIEPHGDVLAVGLGKSVWGVSGTSQYNFQRDELSKTGVTGADAMASDGARLLWIAESGVFRLGHDEPLSDDLRELFTVNVGPAELVIDPRRRHALALIAGRLFVAHLERDGAWGEVVGAQAYGLIRTAQHVGWYGEDGLWVLMGRDTPDQRLDGGQANVISRYDTWEQRPNLDGRGRALLNRTVVHLRGSARGNATYTVHADDGGVARMFSTSVTLADESVDAWSDELSAATPLEWPTRPVRRELVPRVGAETFRHTLSAPCYMEILSFNPQYRFGAEVDE
jgi:hypothetical protein